MWSLIARLISGPLVTKLVDLFVAFQKRRASEAEFRSEVERAIFETFSEVSKEQAGIINAEMHSESWLTRNWRPIVAITLATVPVFYGIITPVAVAWFYMPPVRIGDDLLKWIMDVVVICLGGYIGGRSLEKIVQTIVRR